MKTVCRGAMNFTFTISKALVEPMIIFLSVCVWLNGCMGLIVKLNTKQSRRMFEMLQYIS